MSVRILHINVALVVIATFSVLADGNAQSWWALGVSSCAGSASSHCRDRSNCAQLADAGILNPTQEEKCVQDSAPVRAIALGTREAIIDCHSKFMDRKWTCSPVQNSSLFGNFINDRTRETAVLFAYLVAGAIQKIAEFCRQERIKDCVCFRTTESHRDAENNLIFNKCAEDITWASEYVQKFALAAYNTSSNDPSMRCDLHNIEVGKQSMSTPVRFCSCHGISGTCSVQTCYDKAPDIHEVGESLHQKYDGAVKVELVDGELRKINPLADPLKKIDLAYINDTPDLCVSNPSKGIQGTAHRVCDPSTQNSPKSCSALCCGRGYYKVTETVQKEDCVFVWCCRYDCTMRNVTTIEHKCNP